jgi:hypothetical protein
MGLLTIRAHEVVVLAEPRSIVLGKGFRPTVTDEAVAMATD